MNPGLELPGRVAAALATNDRIKFYFSLLQTAIGRADHPEQAPATLRRERMARVDDCALDNMPATSRRQNGSYKLPGCAECSIRSPGHGGSTS